VGKEQSSGTIDQVWVAPATSSISGWATLGTPSRHVYTLPFGVCFYLHTYLQPRNRRQYSDSITIQLVV
jgi:hypothetical protein